MIICKLGLIKSKKKRTEGSLLDLLLHQVVVLAGFSMERKSIRHLEDIGVMLKIKLMNSLSKIEYIFLAQELLT